MGWDILLSCTAIAWIDAGGIGSQILPKRDLTQDFRRCHPQLPVTSASFADADMERQQIDSLAFPSIRLLAQKRRDLEVVHTTV